MNRRQLLRNGAVAISGLTLGAGQFPGNHVIAQTGAQNNGSPTFGSLGNEFIIPTVKNTQAVARGGPLPLGAESFNYANDNGTPISGASSDFQNQFFVFQQYLINNNPRVVEASKVEPELETNEQNPDIVIDAQLDSFHLSGSDSESIDQNTKATLRLTFGYDDNTERGRSFDDTLYWAITTGINLWNDAKREKSKPKELKTDFKTAFGNKFIELPGAAGNMKLEIIKHRKPSWWEKAFKFLNSNAGRTLTSSLGFPAVTSQVIDFVDQAASNFEGNRAEVLFSSRWMKLAFSKQAKQDIIANGTAVVGSLQNGYWVLARGRDLPKLSNQEMIYNATYGLLIPKGENIEQLISSGRDPLNDVTYAIMKVRMKPRKINVGF